MLGQPHPVTQLGSNFNYLTLELWELPHLPLTVTLWTLTSRVPFQAGISGGVTLPTKDAVWQGRICPDVNTESTGETGGISVRGPCSNNYAIRESLREAGTFSMGQRPKDRDQGCIHQVSRAAGNHGIYKSWYNFFHL